MGTLVRARANSLTDAAYMGGIAVSEDGVTPAKPSTVAEPLSLFYEYE
jgi:hypothetical protein